MRGASTHPFCILRSIPGTGSAGDAATEGTTRAGAPGYRRRWQQSRWPDRESTSPDLRLAMLQAVEKTRAALTSHRETPGLESAARVFDEELTPDQQLAVAEEVVLTRTVELARAYPNTVAISVGPRRKRGDRDHRLSAPPCVRFLVGVKWPPSVRRIPPKGTIPRRLLAMATVDGRRVLCAVPTDVEDARFSTR